MVAMAAAMARKCLRDIDRDSVGEKRDSQGFRQEETDRQGASGAGSL
jgi:hypothetical protein